MTNDTQILHDLASAAERAATFAVFATPQHHISAGVHPEHIAAVLCYLTVNPTQNLPAVAAQAYAILLATAAEYQ